MQELIGRRCRAGRLEGGVVEEVREATLEVGIRVKGWLRWAPLDLVEFLADEAEEERMKAQEVQQSKVLAEKVAQAKAVKTPPQNKALTPEQVQSK